MSDEIIEGTFPLPEAQLDRFLLRINLGYPEKEQEIDILDSQQYAHPIESIEQVVDEKELLEVQTQLREVYVDQLSTQFKAITGKDLPPEVFRDALAVD